ncbi:MAG: PAS domain-containing protein [Candidatus Omnitrophica bacterium]|nr:PAS domain-containing protein [Candidatus Omnitrophota bacterium]
MWNNFLLFLLGCLFLALAGLVLFLCFFRRRLRKMADTVRAVEQRLADEVQAAREGRNRVLAILESMTEGVLAVDTDEKVLFANAALARVLGFPEEKMEGRYFWEVFRDPEINPLLKRALKERMVFKKELSLLLSGLVFHVQISPVFTENDFLGAIAVFYDVTKLKELERVRSEFVANVSHELKTPLTSIMGFVETLKEGGIEDAQNRMNFLGVIEEQSKKLCLLIEDLLLLSKYESAREALKKEPLDLGKMLEGVLELFQKDLRARGLRAALSVSPESLRVEADPASLERALRNLVDNAIKYNREGGEVRVEASRAGEGVEICVSDAGIGIPPADLPRIFERFYRVDKSRSRELGGTGLGLSIVKHIVERHSGKIEVSSEPGKGTTFTILLPG